MTTKIDLKLPQAAFDRFHDQLETRAGVGKVGVQELRQLLMDYSVLLDAVQKSSSYIITDPEPRRARPRLGG